MNELTKTEAKADAPAERDQPALLPAVDVIEDKSGITLFADVPGVPKDKLNIRVDGDQLTVEADTVLALPEGLKPNYAEVNLPRYRRTFTLSKELDADKVNAELTNGVLRLRIPKAEHAQPRKISVNVA